MSALTKEIIGRATMAIVAVALFWAATKLLLRIQSADVGLYVGQILFVPVFGLYVLAFTFACFVFASRNPRKSNVGRVMSWANPIGDMFSKAYMIFFEAWWP